MSRKVIGYEATGVCLIQEGATGNKRCCITKEYSDTTREGIESKIKQGVADGSIVIELTKNRFNVLGAFMNIHKITEVMFYTTKFSSKRFGELNKEDKCAIDNVMIDKIGRASCRERV